MEKFGAVPAPGELTVHRRPLKALTGIRFFAAFYVVMFHTRLAQTLSEQGHTIAGNFFGNGYLAVPLFFLLSGFILAYTYEGQIDEPGGNRRFWEARFARIWPVYAVSMVLNSFPSPGFGSVSKLLAAVFMVQAWNPFDLGMAGVGNLVCWTLSVEALFYLCFPGGQKWIERRGTGAVLAATAGMLLLCVALNTSSRTLGYQAHGAYRWIPLAPLHVPEFFAGVGLGNYFLRRMKLAGARPVRAMLAGRGVMTYLAAAASVALLCRAPDRWTSVVVIAFCALIFTLSAETTLVSRFLSTPTMLLAGGISYSMYLMQMPVKTWMNMAAQRLHVESNAARMVAATALLIAIALVLFKIVEDPARKVIRRMFASSEERRLARAQSKLERTSL